MGRGKQVDSQHAIAKRSVADNPEIAKFCASLVDTDLFDENWFTVPMMPGIRVSVERVPVYHIKNHPKEVFLAWGFWSRGNRDGTDIHAAGKTPREALVKLFDEMKQIEPGGDSPQDPDQVLMDMATSEAQSLVPTELYQKRAQMNNDSYSRNVQYREKGFPQPDAYGFASVQITESAYYEGNEDADSLEQGTTTYSVTIEKVIDEAEGDFTRVRKFFNRQVKDADEVFVVYRTYNRGDTYSYATGLVELLGAFDDEGAAKEFRDLSSAHEYPDYFGGRSEFSIWKQ